MSEPLANNPAIRAGMHVADLGTDDDIRGVVLAVTPGHCVIQCDDGEERFVEAGNVGIIGRHDELEPPGTELAEAINDMPAGCHASLLLAIRMTKMSVEISCIDSTMEPDLLAKWKSELSQMTDHAREISATAWTIAEMTARNSNGWTL